MGYKLVNTEGWNFEGTTYKTRELAVARHKYLKAHYPLFKKQIGKVSVVPTKKRHKKSLFGGGGSMYGSMKLPW